MHTTRCRASTTGVVIAAKKENRAPEKTREHRAVLHMVRLANMEIILSVLMVTMVTMMMVMMTMIGSPKRRSRHHQRMECRP